MIRNVLLATCMVLMLFAGQALAVTEVVVYGDNGYPPYSYEKAGSVAGIYVDVIKAAFDAIPEYKVSIKPIPWKRGLALVEQGKAMGLFPPYRTEDRVSWMAFTEPLLQERVVAFGKRSSLEGKKTWPDDFLGAKVGLNSGFSNEGMGGKAFAEAVKAGKIKVEGAKNTETNLKKLAYGRIDFYLSDWMTDVGGISEGDPITVGPVATMNMGYLGFTRKTEKFPFLPDLISKFDAAVREMKAAGKIEEIIGRYR